MAEKIVQHEIIKREINGIMTHLIKFTESPYRDIMFSYGKVNLIENEDESLTVKYEYDIYEEPKEPYDKAELEIYLGDFLTHLIMEQLGSQELIYRNGTDGKDDIDTVGDERSILEESISIFK